MDEVVVLRREETVRVDPDRLGALYMQLGEHGAEDVVCRAVEELAIRLTDCERLWRGSDLPGLAKSARTIAAISDQVGMTALARVAGDVSATAGTVDTVAQAATLGRMMRVGERSLTAVWDLQHLSV